MELQISNKCLIKCEIDMKRFKSILKKDLNIKEAVYSSASVIEKDPEVSFTNEMIIDALWLGINWGNVLDVINNMKEDIMHIKFNVCRLRDFKRYFPGERSLDGTYFRFDEENVNIDHVIMIQSFIRNPDHNIDNFLSKQLFYYGKKKWKAIIPADIDLR